MAEWTIFGQSFYNVVQFIVSGLLTGGLYALVALGIVVINKASGVFNFAHGWMMFIGGLFFWQFYQQQPTTGTTLAILGAACFLAVSGLYVTIKSGTNTYEDDEVPTDEATSFRVNLGRTLYKYRTIVYGIVFLLGLIAISALFLQQSQPVIRGAAGALVATIIVGLLIERFTIRPLLGQPILTAILMTLAVGFFIQGVIQLTWGEQSRPIPIFKEADIVTETEVAPGIIVKSTLPGFTKPDYTLSTESWLGQDLRLERDKVWGFGVAVTTFIAFAWLFQFTSLGLAMRATAENQVLAESVGLRVRLILAVAWALVAVMAAVAGVLQGTAAGLSIITIPFLALRVFPAVLLGGIDSISGALVGGLVIGVVEKLATLYISTSAGQNMAPYLVLMIVLLIRPEGLFGQKRIDRV